MNNNGTEDQQNVDRPGQRDALTVRYQRLHADLVQALRAGHERLGPVEHDSQPCFEVAELVAILESRLPDTDTGRAAEIDELRATIAELEAQIEELQGATLVRVDDEDTSSNAMLADDIERVLRVTTPDDAQTEIVMDSDHLTIGRTSQNDLQLKFPFVSRRHAVITVDKGCTRITDYFSKNGIAINGRRVKESRLEDGDVIMIGDTRINYSERRRD